ncbi:extracellular solute-binding protein [Azospirillum rugosum]|uniref:Iron(III) transport system substrate-binding protein n=1 Tax=Azospirillum rugosum TaxID=416170 RepID=A0ABS4SQY0_9PROT|nr:extracellular solute-binding protein [Azospirillum rugosum]MBP2294966.1 iron(III) transport system substrate-binding protein [Azospirillum rugosum]MDQ0530984.1 iron(III) transport system substrate-binding protein [Azospirillum rugosum]
MHDLTRRDVLRGGAALAGAATIGLSISRPAVAAPAKLVDLKALYEAAKKEGEITYYASDNPTVSQRVVAAFNAKYPGIKVQIMRLASGPMAKRYATEAQAGNVVADVLQLADPVMIEDAYAKGWITDIDTLPEHAAWPAAFKSPHNAYIGLFPQTITFNTTLAKADDFANGWADLLKPSLKGQIIIPDVRNSPGLMDWVCMLADVYGNDFVRRLGAQEIRWAPSAVPGTQMLAAGEAVCLAPNMRQTSNQVIDKGAPLVDLDPLPTVGHESQITVSTKAPHPNGARLLVDFILSREGQEAYCKNVCASPRWNDIPGALQLPAEYRRANIPDALRRAPEMLSLLGLK